MTPPRNISELRSFLGMVNYFHRFIKNYATIATPLHHLEKKGVKYDWTDSHQMAFEALKAALVSAAVLRSFDQRDAILVQTDASNVGVGAVLLQQAQGDALRPVAFASRKLNIHELNYTVQEKEGLAVAFALDKFEHYLDGLHFKLETDHQSLTFLKKSPRPSQRLLRWLDLFARFDFEPVYRPGQSNEIADSLSRLLPEQRLMATYDISYDSKVIDGIKAAYATDDYFGPLFKVLVLKEKAPAALKSRVGRFRVADGLLYFKDAAGDRLCVPKSEFRLTLLRESHSAPSGGHVGQENTYLSVSRRFFWPKMAGSVVGFVEACVDCQKTKPSNQKTPGLLKPLEIPSAPWESIATDFITGLPLSNGWDSIQTVVDRFSKMVHFIPTTKDVTAQETANLFLTHIMRLHGLPRRIVSDRDPKFTSDFWESLFAKLETKLAMSTADHPQSDGQSERANGVIIRMLKTFCFEKPTEWSSFLPVLEFAINSQPSASTKVSPFECCYGWRPRMPLDLLSPGLPPLYSSLPAIHRFVKDNLVEAQDRQAAQANKERREVSYKVGERVLLRMDHSSPNTTVGDKPKLQEDWSGPYKIVELKPNAVKLDLPSPMRIHPVVNVDKVKPFIEPLVPHQEPGPETGTEDVYEVEKILKSKTTKSKGLQYLVRWQGYDATHDSWLHESELKDSREVLEEFLERVKKTSAPPSRPSPKKRIKPT